ncbi:MAG: FIST N-terminal domain-containing protein [bacterium]
MPIYAGVGRSSSPDPKAAGDQATQAALRQLNQKPNILIVFSSVVYDQQKLIEGIKGVSPDTPIAGCSDAGEITTDGPTTKSVAVMALASPDVKFIIGIGHGVKADSRGVGKAVAEDIKNKTSEPISLFVMFPDGVNGNGADIVRGVQDVFGKNFPIMGGSAGDDFAFKKTFQYFNGEVLSDSVVAVGFSGQFSFGVGVRHGWEPIGLPMKVTKSEGAVLKELDGKPALKIYEDSFGKQAEDLIKEPLANLAYTYPLGMSVEGSDEFLIRDAVLANEKGEITCAAEIPEGKEVRLMLGDRDKAIVAAKEAAESAKEQIGGKRPDAIFVFNCIARYKLLGPKIGDEIKAIQKVFGETVPMIGFYTYGEQAPLGGKLGPDCNSCFHNETIALLAFSD